MNKNNRTEAVVSMLLGLAMIGWWSMALIGDRMPEIRTTPIDASLHLVVEFLTGASLIVGGTGLLLYKSWGKIVHYVSLGMLLYAVIQASGYYAERGNMVFVALFGLVAAAVAFFLAAEIFGKGSRLVS